MSAPIVPQRPSRSLNPQSTATVTTDFPKSATTSARSFARSQSRDRNTFARSPLNEYPPTTSFTHNGSLVERDNFGGQVANRKPSVPSLPLIGQEGAEYASLNEALEAVQSTKDSSDLPNQTRNVAGDLPLHAPKASVPVGSATARSRIAPITRTDTEKASIAGIGKPTTEYDEPERLGRPLSAKAEHYRPPSSVSGDRTTPSFSRAESAHGDEHEHGIPMIGFQVPMYPNAGDVQAPSPAPYSVHSPGVGFFNDGSRSQTQSGRRRSAQGFHGPPGSYGLHGHGFGPQDAFEKQWYQKHPDEAAKEEHGAYGPSLSDRGQWAMSSEELNKLVRESRGPGMGTSPDVIGTPTELIGYIATEEYASRRESPRPLSLNVTRSHTESGGHAESPLRQAVFPEIDETHGIVHNDADDKKIHIDPPGRRGDKYAGGGYDPPTEELGPRGGNTEDEGGWITERGPGIPILASDEVSKDPAAEWLQPAISPEQEKRGDTYFSGVDSDAPPPYQSGHHQTRSRSRPSSRPTSLHGSSGLSRFMSRDFESDTGTPLEEIEEYEPLFEDEEESEVVNKLRGDEKSKRLELERHRFPSQDIWEDTPNSLQLQTTVSTVQELDERDRTTDKSSAAVFEMPDKELARKGEITEEERLDFLNDPSKGYAKPKFRTDVREEMMGRPRMRPRFPSQDIWEDTADSLRLETTVDQPQKDSITSPQDSKSAIEPKVLPTSVSTNLPIRSPTTLSDKPSPPGRPARSKPMEAPHAQPQVPDRPPQRQKRTDPVEMPIPHAGQVEVSELEKKPPSIPDRPKPHIPPRPVRDIQDDTTEPVPITKAISTNSTPLPVSDKVVMGPAIIKAKPLVPPRPQAGTSKIASLKAGFMNDLNVRLQLGPPTPPKAPAVEHTQETQEDKKPLLDARRDRAKGPARKKPAAALDVGEGVQSSTVSRPACILAQPWTVWSIADKGVEDIIVGVVSLERKKTTANITVAPPPTSSSAPGIGSGTARQDSEDKMDAESAGKEAKSEPLSNQTPPLQLLGLKTPSRTAYLVTSNPVTEHLISADVSQPKENSILPEVYNHDVDSPQRIVSLQDEAVQTGEHVIISSIRGEDDKMHQEHVTAYVGGDAQGNGNVLVVEEQK